MPGTSATSDLNQPGSPSASPSPRKLKKKGSLRKQKGFTLTEEELRTLKLKLHSAIIGSFSDPRRFFRRFDKDKDGRLEEAELRRCIRLGMKVNPNDLSDDHLKKFMEQLDVNKDGYITVDEICAFVGISIEDGRSLDMEEQSGAGGVPAKKAEEVRSGSSSSSKKDAGRGGAFQDFIKSMTSAGGSIVHKVQRALFARTEDGGEYRPVSTDDDGRGRGGNGSSSKSKSKKLEEGGADEEEEDRNLMIAIVVMLALVFVAIVDGFTTKFGARFSVALADFTLEHAPGSFVLFHLIIMVLIILCLPYGPLAVLSGALFETKYGAGGVVLAGLVLYCSTLSAEYVCYLLGRHKFKQAVERKVNANPELHFLRSLDRLIVEGEGVNMVMLLRLAPLPKGPAN